MRLFFLTFFLSSALCTTVLAGSAGEIKVGDVLREATLDGLHGKTKKFSDFKGKPLIINVWARLFLVIKYFIASFVNPIIYVSLQRIPVPFTYN